MSKCIMTGCNNKRTKKTLTNFFIIPRRPEKRRKEWLLAAGENPDDQTNRRANRFICQDHFSENDFYFKEKNGRRCVKSRAVPSKLIVTTGSSSKKNEPTVTNIQVNPPINLSPPPIVGILNGRPLALTPAQPGSSGLMPNNQWVTQPSLTQKPIISSTIFSLPPISLPSISLPQISLPPLTPLSQGKKKVTINSESILCINFDENPSYNSSNDTKDNKSEIFLTDFAEKCNQIVIKEEPELCINDNENDNYDDVDEIEMIEEKPIFIDVSAADESESNSNSDEKCDVAMENTADIKNYNYYDFSDPATWPELTKDIIELIVAKGPIQITESDMVFPVVKNRKFTSKHYSRELANGSVVPRQWLVYSKSNDSLFCFPCKLFTEVTPSSVLIALISCGYSDWSNAFKKMKDHERNVVHLENVRKWKLLENSIKKDQNNQIITTKRSINRETNHWRDLLTRCLTMAQFLVTQNLEFGESSTNDDQFHILLEQTSKFDAILMEHFRRIKNNEIDYAAASKNIENDLIDIIIQGFKDKVKTEIKAAKYYSFIVDSLLDNYKNERVALTIRYVLIENGVICVKEVFLGFLEIENALHLNLTKLILRELENYGLAIVNCRGQSYDKNANMNGRQRGMQNHISIAEPRAFFVPCSTHSLIFDISDGAKISQYTLNLFKTIENLYNFFATSSKRWDILQKHGLVYTKLPDDDGGDRRWECQIAALKPILFQLERFNKVFCEIAIVNEDTQNDATRISKSILDFQFIVSLTIWYDIIYKIIDCSIYLQNPKMSISHAIDELNLAKSSLDGIKNDEKFECYVKRAEEIAQELDIPIEFSNIFTLRSVCKKNALSCDDKIFDAKQKFREDFYYKILNQTIDTLTEKHQQFIDHMSMFSIFYDIQAFTLNAPFFISLEKSLTFVDKCDINHNEIAEELTLLSSIIQPNTSPFDTLNFIYQNHLDISLPNTVVVLRILLSLPITLVELDENKDTNKLAHIKNYLRSSVGENKLNCFAIMAVEKDLVLNLNLDTVIDDFAKTKAKMVQNYL